MSKVGSSRSSERESVSWLSWWLVVAGDPWSCLATHHSTLYLHHHMVVFLHVSVTLFSLISVYKKIIHWISVHPNPGWLILIKFITFAKTLCISKYSPRFWGDLNLETGDGRCGGGGEEQLLRDWGSMEQYRSTALGQEHESALWFWEQGWSQVITIRYSKTRLGP